MKTTPTKRSQGWRSALACLAFSSVVFAAQADMRVDADGYRDLGTETITISWRGTPRDATDIAVLVRLNDNRTLDGVRVDRGVNRYVMEWTEVARVRARESSYVFDFDGFEHLFVPKAQYSVKVQALRNGRVIEQSNEDNDYSGAFLPRGDRRDRDGRRDRDDRRDRDERRDRDGRRDRDDRRDLNSCAGEYDLTVDAGEIFRAVLTIHDNRNSDAITGIVQFTGDRPEAITGSCDNGRLEFQRGNQDYVGHSVSRRGDKEFTGTFYKKGKLSGTWTAVEIR